MTRYGLLAASLATLITAPATISRAQAGFNDLVSEVSFASSRHADRQTRRTGHGRVALGGLATWYGPGFRGRRTASGERFDPNAMTAAHRSLPFGARVEVTNVATGRSVVVRINDRGPHRRGAVIDLSRASARALGIGGSARVRLATLG